MFLVVLDEVTLSLEVHRARVTFERSRLVMFLQVVLQVGFGWKFLVALGALVGVRVCVKVQMEIEHFLCLESLVAECAREWPLFRVSLQVAVEILFGFKTLEALRALEVAVETMDRGVTVQVVLLSESSVTFIAAKGSFAGVEQPVTVQAELLREDFVAVLTNVLFLLWLRKFDAWNLERYLFTDLDDSCSCWWHCWWLIDFG